MMSVEPNERSNQDQRGRENVVSVTYPLIDGQQELDLEVSRNSKRVLSMKFDLEDRVIAYQAALSAQGLLNS